MLPHIKKKEQTLSRSWNNRTHSICNRFCEGFYAKVFVLFSFRFSFKRETTLTKESNNTRKCLQLSPPINDKILFMSGDFVKLSRENASGERKKEKNISSFCF